MRAMKVKELVVKLDTESVVFLNHVDQFIASFSDFSFPKGFGFEGYHRAYVLAYFERKSIFQFSLNKDKGRHVLYGKDHVLHRQTLLNTLPQDIRVSLIQQKIQFFKLEPVLTDYFSEHITLTDVIDIGMGHSVYLLTVLLSTGQSKKVVLKKEELSNQSFFSELLTFLKWPSYYSKHFELDGQGWELTEYLGAKTLASYQPTPETVGSILRQLADHAALGDFFGRGDRHIENYVVIEGDLFPIDISFLFWENNEDWVKKYISGGLYEVNMYDQLFMVYQQRGDCLTSFFAQYFKTAKLLKYQQSELIQLIKNSPWLKHHDQQKIQSYIKYRFENIDTYISEQKLRYKEGFDTYLKRRKIKHVLTQQSKSKPFLNDPYFKMYQLADRDRSSAFFLLEDQPQSFQNALMNLSV